MRFDATGPSYSVGSKALGVSKWVAHITNAGKSAAGGAAAPQRTDAIVDAGARLATRWARSVEPGRSYRRVTAVMP
jgi:hypothetical protein